MGLQNPYRRFDSAPRLQFYTGILVRLFLLCIQSSALPFIYVRTSAGRNRKTELWNPDGFGLTAANDPENTQFQLNVTFCETCAGSKRERIGCMSVPDEIIDCLCEKGSWRVDAQF